MFKFVEEQENPYLDRSRLKVSHINCTKNFCNVQKISKSDLVTETTMPKKIMIGKVYDFVWIAYYVLFKTVNTFFSRTRQVYSVVKKFTVKVNKSTLLVTRSQC